MTPTFLRFLAAAFAIVAALSADLARAQPTPAAAQPDPTAQRLSLLEEQLVDLQVVVGTLQSLAHRGPIGAATPGQVAGAGAPGADLPVASSDDLAPRIDALETQIRALTGQIEQMAERLAKLQLQLGSVGAVPPAVPGANSMPPPGSDGQTGSTPQAPTQTFGTTTVNPGRFPAPRSGPFQPMIQSAPAAPPGGTGQLAALPVGPDARTMYEEAYGYLMQRDFEAAEAGFKRLIAAHPTDELSGNAYYWLGELYFTRGKYKPAADNFLDSYRLFPAGSKAPDSLLRLGMALSQLGQKSAACDSLSALNTKFPDAPEHIRQKADAESRRNGCS